MYIETVRNRTSPPAILLRESFREGDKVHKRTLVNLTKWPEHIVDGLRSLLKGTPLIAAEQQFAIQQSLPHGHVRAVLDFIQHLGLDKMIAPLRSRERDLVMAMIAERIIDPCSKLATTRAWHSTTLSQELDVCDADEDELYSAMDWLLKHQRSIENSLARRHLQNGSMVLYDVSSSYYEGHCCPLAQFGHNRDEKIGRRIIVYGLLTDSLGCPVAVDVYPGNTGDPTTVPDQVKKLRDRFGLSRVVLVGDRGMLTQTQIDELDGTQGIGWISALRSTSIQKLLKEEYLQMSLFDEQNIAEITSPDFPKERLIACFNPLLCDDRRRTREELIAATEAELKKIAREIARRTKSPFTNKEIALKVGSIINKHKVAKHFTVDIENSQLTWEKKQSSIDNEMKLDGIYVIRTSEPSVSMQTEDVVRNYKRLAQVEQAFRTLKSIDLLVRPIRHRNVDRVRAHILICMLSYYVVWHMRKALDEILFVDEELDSERLSRDPVLPAQPSESVQRKKLFKINSSFEKVHSFKTLIKSLGTICKNICRLKANPESPTFTLTTIPDSYQEKILNMLKMYPVPNVNN
jgi:transposase